MQVRLLRFGALVVVALLTMIPLAAQTAAMRARIEGVVSAFNGTPAEFEKYVQQAYAPARLEQSTPGGRRAFYDRARDDFGTMSMQKIERASPTRVRVSVAGSTGLRATLILDHEEAEPHKVTNVQFELDEEPETAVPVHGRMTAEELAAALDPYVAQLVARDQFAGTVLIARDGKPLFEKAYGLADRSNGVPNTVQTRHNIGSINKHFTRAALAHLIAAGKLAPSDTVGKHLPDYPVAALRDATIQQLIDMEGGVADIFSPEFTREGKQRFRTNRDYYEFVSPKPLLFPPGSNKQYCNGCYVVLGEIVTRLSGMPYERFVEEHVFRRAGMQTAAFLFSDAIVPNVAMGYTRAEGETLRNNVLMHGAGASAAGGAYATARDLLVLDEAIRTGSLLGPKGTAWFFKADKPFDGRVPREGQYGGGAAGLNAAVAAGATWTVVVMANLDPPAASDLAGGIYAALKK